MRTILDPVKVSENEYRRRTNLEILKELDDEDIAVTIKMQRIR